ncbi:unnamed protein product [Protopolystoma xenopodis]|uniref:Uncharacterized protein n=1 Tax=Protopolystoma xenopodis TaxID=117903 RepID=A0A448WQJ3_9PLAT|nr:unnamed protein product [Protopolystoma xenopodis]
MLYQWNRRSRHRLCFYGNLRLTETFGKSRTLLAGVERSLNEPKSSEKSAYSDNETHEPRQEALMDRIALQLEPTGVLYLELAHLPMPIAYARRPVLGQPGALFGVPLSIVLQREGNTVPYILRKSIEEVSRIKKIKNCVNIQAALRERI